MLKREVLAEEDLAVLISSVAIPNSERHHDDDDDDDDHNNDDDDGDVFPLRPLDRLQPPTSARYCSDFF